jgi:hypothetical protein
MNLNNLDWDQMPADAGQIVNVEYSVDWENNTLYRQSTDRGDRTVAVEQATITGGEYDPQNCVLPNHGEWRPADAATAAAAGRGLHYLSPEWTRLADEVEWHGEWPEVDGLGNLTGRVIDSAEGFANVEDSAMIARDEARRAGWTIEDGYATPPA